MIDTASQAPPASPTWSTLYAEKQNLAQTAPTPELRAHYAAEVKVMAPAIAALEGDGGVIPAIPAPQQGVPVFADGASNNPPALAGSEPPVPVARAKPTLTDDSQGHTVGHIVATDPSEYDKWIQEACDYYGKRYGVDIDPNLVKAHIWQESKGDPFALSQDGQLSRGLMQVSNSASVPTASILSVIKNPDGSSDTNIPPGGGNQYDPRTSIFTGVKYDALAMSGQMVPALEKSGYPGTELGTFPTRPLTQLEAMRAYQGGPGVLANPSMASRTYELQLTGLQKQFAEGKAPSDPGYANPAGGPGWKEPAYGSIV